MSTSKRDIAAKAAYEKHIGRDISMAGDQAAWNRLDSFTTAAQS